MTINVALVCRDALILGCDSIASSTKAVIEPWRFVEKDGDGNPILDDQGRLVAKFDASNYEWVVTDAWGGVTKMFELSRTRSKVAATTAGMAALHSRSIHSLAEQFFKEFEEGGGMDSVEAVAQQFLAFVRHEYDLHYAGGDTPELFKNDVEFLIGGYGPTDHFPSLYRLNVKPNTCSEIYKDGSVGLSWAGQSDGVARLVFGFDHLLKFRIQKEVAKMIDDKYDEFSQTVARILKDVLEELKAELPEGIDTQLPEKPKLEFPWGEYQLDIEMASLPLQDAVDLVSYLVNLQSGRAKFVRGVATVGGRTRIGVLTRNADFRMLNEPEIVHRSTGFPVDL